MLNQILLVFLTLAIPAAAENATPPKFVPPSANVALHAPYTLVPAPNYALCTDPGDKEQLTDGIYTEGYFWTQKSTVGWSGVKPVIIALDLGAVKSIRGVSFNTAAGVAGVTWPASILLFAADEPGQFHSIGNLVDLSAKKGLPPAEGYAVHRFWTDELKTHGRYVGFVVFDQPFTFVDEIEVYEGDPDWLKAPLPGEAIPDMKAFVQRLAIHDSVARRLRNDIQAIGAAADDPSVPEAARAQVKAELEAVRDEIAALPMNYGPDFKAILPLNAAHERLFRAQARLWEAKGLSGLMVWQSPLWDDLSLLATPDASGKPEVRMQMMAGESRAASINLSNATQTAMALDLKFAGLPGAPCPPYVRVHSVEWTDTNSGVPVAAALPDAERKGGVFAINIPSGMTRQVWFTFHPTDLPPGEYAGHIELAGKIQIPVALKVYPMKFPERPALHLGGWDYTDVPNQYQVTAENRRPLIAHLREHFVDSPWGTSVCLPFGKYDASGNVTAPPDTAHFDQWLDLWPNAGQYLVFAAVGDNLAGLAMGAPAFDTAVKAWITFWAKHAAGKGIKPEQLAVLLIDEPSTRKQDDAILAWAKPFRAANTGVRVWEDPTHRDMAKANIEMIRACNVVCPNRPLFLQAPQAYRDYFADRQKEGIRMSFYSCSGPARLLDPYSYYRLQAWDCWRYGADSTYFWAFGDGGGASSWNEYLEKNTAYTPLFLDDKTVVAGKQMEACRESVEDFEYLVMLRHAIQRAEEAKKDSALIERARHLLDDAPKKVCEAAASNKAFTWRTEMDRGVADRVRVELLEAIQGIL